MPDASETTLSLHKLEVLEHRCPLALVIKLHPVSVTVLPGLVRPRITKFSPVLSLLGVPHPRQFKHPLW